MTLRISCLASFWLATWVSIIAAESFDDSVTAPAAVILESTSHGDNWADCDGVYLLTSYIVNGKVVFVNEQKNRFLAYQGNSKGKWSVASIVYLDGVIEDQTDFSAYHLGGDAESPAGDWAVYNVHTVDIYALAFQSKQAFDARGAAGIYELSSTLTDAGKPVYINVEKGKFATRYNSGWTINDTTNLEAVRRDISNAQLSQFLTTGTADPESGWYDYNVAATRFGTLIIESEEWDGTFVFNGQRNRRPVFRELFWTRDLWWNSNQQKWVLQGVAGIGSSNPDISNGTSWEPRPVEILINYKSVEGSSTSIRICEDACAQVGGRSLEGADKCFFSSREVLSWHDAQRWCQQHAGELAAIGSEEEHALAVEMFNDKEPKTPTWDGHWRMWIGLNDLEEENTFVWSDGTPVDYHNWSPDEPDDLDDDEDCGEVRMWDQQWNDNLCSRPQPFLCAKKYRPPPATWKRLFKIGQRSGSVFDFVNGGEILFHLSARPNEGQHGQLVLNTKLGGDWGQEVRLDVSFPANDEFEVFVDRQGWHLTYGSHWSHIFAHRGGRTGAEAYRAFFYVQPTECTLSE